MLRRRTTAQDDLLGGRSPLPPPPPGRRRKRPRRGSFLRPLAILAAVSLVAYLTLPLLWHAGRLRPVVEATVARDLGRAVSIGNLTFTLGFGTLIATDVTVADDPAFSAAPFLKARRVELSVRRLPLLLHGTVEITGVSIEEPAITLIHNAAQWNFYGVVGGGPMPSATSPGLPFRVRNGIITIRAGDRGNPLVLRGLNLDAPRFNTTAESTFTLAATVGGGGIVKLNGKTGAVRWQSGAPVIPMSILINAKDVDMAQSNLTASLAPALGGLLSVDAAVESDGRFVQVDGNIGLSRLKLAQGGSPAEEPLVFLVSIQHDLASRSGALSRCDYQIRNGTGGIQGRYMLSDGGANVQLKVTGHGVPVSPLSGMLPAAGLPLPGGASLQGGVLFLDLAVNGPLDRPTTTGTVVVNNTRLANFDLADRLAAIDGLDLLHFNHDLEIKVLRSTVALTREQLAMSDMELELPELGVLTGNGAILADRTLDFRMSAVRTGLTDKRPIPFAVRGACTAPIFRQPGKLGK